MAELGRDPRRGDVLIDFASVNVVKIERVGPKWVTFRMWGTGGWGPRHRLLRSAFVGVYRREAEDPEGLDVRTGGAV